MMRWQQWAVAVIVAAIFMASIKAPVMAQDKPAAPGFYGLYAWVTDVNKYADDLNKAGIRWLRVGGWAGQNSADDTACLVAARNGFHLVPTLFMREISHSRSMPIDELIPAWRKVVRESVQRYGPAGTLWKENPSVPPQPVRYWQIWNEPNIEFLNPPQGVTRVQLYAELLKAASEEIRKLDPGATIIAFNTAGGAALGKPSPDVYVEQHKFFGWRRFIKESNEITGVACFDAIGLHPYTMPDGPEAGGVAKGLQLLRELAVEQKLTDKQVWFTEIGYPLDYPQNKQVRDERQQACFMARLFAISAAHGVTQVEPMFITDIVYGPDNSKRTFGLFTAPGKWREQATAIRTMNHLLPDPRKDAKVLSEAENGVWAYRFVGANDWPVVMIWNAGSGEVEHELQVPGKSVTVVDMLGKDVRSLETSGGKVRLSLSEAPLYIIPAAKEEVAKVLAAE